MTRRLTLFVLILLALAACGLSGSGNLETEPRDVAAFSRLEVSGALRVTVTVDPAAATSVEVTFDDNLLDRITTRVANDTLVVKSEGNYRVSRSGRGIDVVTPTLTEIRVSGASDVTGFGDATTIDHDVSGASDVDLSSLRAAAINLDVSGASDVIINVLDDVSGDVSGASSLLVLGDPPRMDIDSSGASDVDTG